MKPRNDTVAMFLILALAFTACATRTVEYKSVSSDGDKVTLTVPIQRAGGDTKESVVTSMAFPSDGSPVIVSVENTSNGPAAIETKSQERGAVMFYCLAAAAGLAALAFIWFKHFKLAMLAGIAVAGFTTLGVTIGMFPQIYAYAAAITGGILLLYIGVMLWRDYKDDGLINLSLVAKSSKKK